MNTLPASRSIISVVSLSAAMMLSSAALAEVRYVSDVIYIPVRAEANPQASVIQRSIPSGTKLTLIKEDKGTDNASWSLVITPEGNQGWVRTQNITDKPTAAMVLSNLGGNGVDVANLAQENQQLKEELSKLQQEHQQLLADTEEVRQNATLALNLEDEHSQLLAQNQLLQTRADIATAENEKLRNTDRFNQWVYGGGLMLGGVILSFFLQMLGRRKRRSEWG